MTLQALRDIPLCLKSVILHRMSCDHFACSSDLRFAFAEKDISNNEPGGLPEREVQMY
jgi:hypothetical protein